MPSPGPGPAYLYKRGKSQSLRKVEHFAELGGYRHGDLVGVDYVGVFEFDAFSSARLVSPLVYAGRNGGRWKRQMGSCLEHDDCQDDVELGRVCWNSEQNVKLRSSRKRKI